MAELIQRILDGGEEEFSILVRKYQKGIHALAWRKVGDYHIAEELTQDTFIQVYKKLHTLKNPNQFEGWLYVIANRLCINWVQRNKSKIPVQSIEETPVEEMEKAYHTHYVSEQRKQEDVRHNQAIVEKLLSILPESDRTVLTLYYLGEMTAKEISKFLGVSVNTIKSKIRRARNHLKKEGEHLITENLPSVQLSTDLTENIMRKIADIKPTPPIAKPVFPWAAFGTAAVLVMLLLGSMQQYITHFQKPYNFDTPSEPTIEIVESPINIDIVSIPSERNKIGRSVINSRREGTGAMVSDDDFNVNVQDNALNSSVERWRQTDGPQGSPLFNLFSTSKNNVYAVSSTGVYRLTEDEEIWMNTNASVPISSFQAPITEYQGVIYSVNTDEISTSTDSGETWNRFCYRPAGDAVGLIIKNNTQEKFAMYLALQDEGVFRSTDAGRKWIHLNNGLTGKKITAVTTIENSIFIGTNQGLYRLNLGVWNPLSVDPLRTVHSMAVFENNLYVLTGPDFLSHSPDKMRRKIFHSNNLGSTWREITPKDKSFATGILYRDRTKIAVAGKTILVLDIPALRSKDAGKTWTNLGINPNLFPSNNSQVLGTNEHTFYKVGSSGILRTTDSGDTWYPFTNGIVKTKVEDLVVFNNILYVYTGTELFKSIDNGHSWDNVHIDYGEFTPDIMENGTQMANYIPRLKLVFFNNTLYGIIPKEKKLYIFRLRPNDAVFSIVQRVSMPSLLTSGEDVMDTSLSDTTEGFIESGEVAVSGKTLFIEYSRKLFKWTFGSADIIDTGLIDANIYADEELDRGFKIAASAEIVYVTKRGSKLFQSIDSGNSWRDVRLNIPYNFTRINDITFVGETVYVATDKGVLASQTGEHWRLLTDNIGTHIIINKFAIYGTKFFGAGDTGVYSLNPLDRWEQISSNTPDKVISLSASHDKLYIGTENRGIFHTLLEEGTSEVNVTKQK